MAKKKKKKKKKQKYPSQPAAGKRKRMNASQIAFTIFAILIVTSFLISLIARGS